MQVTIGTLGRAHGLRGEVSVMLKTDNPELRLAKGTQFSNSLGNPATLTVAKARIAGDRWYVGFAEVTDRNGAEALNGGVLTLDIDLDAEAETDPDAWYPDQLVGLKVVTRAGRELGTVTDIEHYPAQDLLIISEPGNDEAVMLPLVTALVPTVDIKRGMIIATPPGGLFNALPADQK